MRSKTKEIRIKPYEEAVGTYQGLRRDEYTLSVIFEEFQVIFRADSPEAEILEQSLANIVVGERIAILATDLEERPVIIRVLKEPSDANLSVVQAHFLGTNAGSEV